MERSGNDPKYISSRQNEKILSALRLKDRKHRQEEGLFFFEGKKLFEEALQRAVPLQSVFLREDWKLSEAQRASLPEGCALYVVAPGVYEKLSEEKSPEGVFCVAKTIDKYHKFATIYNSREFLQGAQSAGAGAGTILFAVSVRDPGNLGTVVRSCAALGASELILTADCADLYHPRTVRASMGTLFDLPVTTVQDAGASIGALRRQNVAVYGSALDPGALPPKDLPDGPCCFLLGNEGHGLPQELLDLCSGKVFIPMTGRAESLNVSAAAAILLYSRFGK